MRIRRQEDGEFWWLNKGQNKETEPKEPETLEVKLQPAPEETKEVNGKQGLISI